MAPFFNFSIQIAAIVGSTRCRGNRAAQVTGSFHGLEQRFVAAIHIRIIADSSIILRPCREIGNIDWQFVLYRYRPVFAAGNLFAHLINTCLQNSGRHIAWLVQANATGAVSPRCPVEKAALRRVMHVNRMLVRKENFQFTQAHSHYPVSGGFEHR